MNYIKSQLLTISFTLITISAFSINPKKEYENRPERWDLNYKELKIETPDNYFINTWVLEPLKDQASKKPL